MDVRRAVLCLIGAVAAHVAVAIGIARTPIRVAEMAASGVETEIDVVADEASEPRAAETATPEVRETAPVASAAAAAAEPNVKVNSLSLSGSGGAAGAAGGGAGAAETAAPSSSASGSVQLFAVGPADLGIAGSSGGNPFLPKRDESARNREGDGKNALRDAFRARDTALGLGPEGPVVSAVRDAAYGSASPVNGRAIFEVHAGEGGIITLVDVVSAEGGSWSDAQRVAQERLASVKLVLPRGAKGAVFRIEVTSKWAMPAATGFGTRPAEGENGPAITFPDPSNIGAKPRRVVRAQVASSHVE